MFLLLMVVYATEGITQFAQEPVSLTAVIGESVTVHCLVDGQTKENANLVQWLKGNLALGFPPLTQARYTQRIGPNDYSLQIDDIQLSDEDEYECQITPFGLRSKVAKLEALAPPKTVDISPVGGEIKIKKSAEKEVYQVVEGSPTRLRCIATDSKPITKLQWSLSEQALNSSESVSGDVLLTTLSEVILVPKKEDHGKQINCVATNQALKKPTAVSVELDVLSLPDVIVKIPEKSLSEGESLVAECQVEANPPVHTYRWRFNGNILDSKNSSKIQIDNLDWKMDRKDLTCLAINTVGEATDTVQISITYAPALKNSEPQRVIANESGEHVELECEVVGNPAPAVTWTLNDVIISEGKLLTFNPVSQADAGKYFCEASNEFGSVIDLVELAVRGPPLIMSAKEQFGRVLECAFTAEPTAQMVKVIDLSKIGGDEIVHESYEENRTQISIEIEAGQYECQVRNELGMASTIIRMHPEGLAMAGKVGIVFGILFTAFILIIIACMKLKFFPREHRLKMNQDIVRDDYNGGNSRSEKKLSQNFKRSIEIIHPSGFSGATKVETQSHEELYNSDVEDLIQRPPIKSLALNNVNSEAGSTGRSAQDDGYGTESGSNQKVNTVLTDSSHSESNSDYEVHVASLTSSAAIASSERSSKICVIWDDATIHAYQPQQIRNQTQLIQTRINRTRSVSHV